MLALGGGGARGLAHIGVLEVLEEEGIPVVAVAGTSAGAVVGAMWLALGGAAEVRRRWQEFLSSGLLPSSLPDVRLTDDVTSRDNLLLHFAQRVQRGATLALALEKRSLIAQADLDRAIAFLLPDVTIESLRLPFAAVATEFTSGEPVAIRGGSLRLAVCASSAVPGVVPPYTVEDRVLLDGGAVADVPVEAARALARRPVVAVDTGEASGVSAVERLTVPRALMHASILTHAALRRRIVEAADAVLSPVVGRRHWSEFADADEAIAAGREAATGRIRRLRTLANASRRGRGEGGPGSGGAGAPIR